MKVMRVFAAKFHSSANSLEVLFVLYGNGIGINASISNGIESR
jgi:hypothetical protein